MIVALVLLLLCGSVVPALAMTEQELTERQLSSLTLSPTLRDAGGSATQSSPEPAIYLVATKDGSVVRARAGMFLHPRLFVDTTVSSTVSGSRGSAITVDGLTPGTSLLGRTQFVAKRLCVDKDGNPECLDTARLAKAVAAPETAKRATQRGRSLTPLTTAEAIALRMGDEDLPWIRLATILTFTSEQTYKKPSYFAPSASSSVTKEHWTNASTFAFGVVGQRRRNKLVEPEFYLSVSAGRADDITAPREDTFCFPVSNSVATKCEKLFSAEPVPYDGLVVKAEGRYWITQSIAVGVEYHRNQPLKEWTLQVPVQVFASKKSIDDPLGDAGGTATGGVAFERKHQQGVTSWQIFAYLGTAFQLPQLPK